MRPATATGPAATGQVAGRVLTAVVVATLLAAAFLTFRALADVDPRGRASWTNAPIVIDDTPRDVTAFLPACSVRAVRLHPLPSADGQLAIELLRRWQGPSGQIGLARMAGHEARARGVAPVTLPMIDLAPEWRLPLTLRIRVVDPTGTATTRLRPITLDPARPITVDTIPRSNLGTFACAFDGGNTRRAWSVVLATLVLLCGTGLLAASWLSRAAGHRLPIAERAAPWVALSLTGATTLVYLFVVPPFEPPDELAHLQYARYVATTGTLPRDVPRHDSEWRASSYEWVQQPLYYLGAAAVLRAANLHAPGPAIEANPGSRLQPGGTEPTIFRHGRPPVPDTGHRALLLLRIVSLVMALATTWLVARLVATVSNDPLLIATVAGGLGLIPQWCAVMGAVSTDPPATLLAAAATLAIVHVGLGRRSTRWLLLTGALVGAAYAVKATTVFLAPMALLACLAAERRASGVTSEANRARPSARSAARTVIDAVHPMLVIGIGALVVAGWIPLRAWLVHGDPQASAFKRAVLEAGGFVPTAGPMPWTPEFWRQMQVMVFEPFWARFGSLGAGPFPGSRVWIAYGVASALLLAFATWGTAAALRAVASRRERPADAGRRIDSMVPVLLCAVGVALGLAAWAAVNLMPRADMVVHWTPRHVLPLTAPAATLVAAGLERLRHASPAVRRVGDAVVGVTVAVLALASLGVLRATVLMFHFGY